MKNPVSTIFIGFFSRPYLNTNPDFANKYYWVMTSMGGCNQKTYLTIPTAIKEINLDASTMEIYPNPANQLINVVINTTLGTELQVEVIDMMGRKMKMAQTINHKSTINVANLASGFYLVNSYQDGVKISSARFSKN